MRPNPPARRLLWMGIAWASLCSCSHGVVVHAHQGQLSGAVTVKLVMVAPVELRWEEPSSLLSYLRSLDLEEALCRKGTIATLGPGELAAMPGAPETPSETDVSRVALKSQIPVAEILLLRAWVERREQRSSVRLNDAAGKAAGSARDAQGSLVAHVELSLPAMHATIAEVSAEQELDPAIDRPLLDAQPELAALLARAVDEVLAVAGDKLVLPPAIDLGLQTLPAPAPALVFALPKGRSFAQSIATQDSLEQEVSREAALDLLAHPSPPLLTPSGAEVAATAPDASQRRAIKADVRGLRVTEAHGRSRAAGLLPGDQILRIDGLPATHPCAPLRAALLSDRGARLEVDRGGQEKSLKL